MVRNLNSCRAAQKVDRPVPRAMLKSAREARLSNIEQGTARSTDDAISARDAKAGGSAGPSSDVREINVASPPN
jgi:hypothetical protein